jgi:hypothetical protein
MSHNVSYQPAIRYIRFNTVQGKQANQPSSKWLAGMILFSLPGRIIVWSRLPLKRIIISISAPSCLSVKLERLFAAAVEE